MMLHGEDRLLGEGGGSPGKWGGSWECTRRSRSWSCAKDERVRMSLEISTGMLPEEGLNGLR